MWFRRRRRFQVDVASLEASLERLAVLVERLVALIPDLASARAFAPVRAPVEPAPAPPSAPEPPSAPGPDLAAHVLFAGGTNGYRLLERDGSPPDRGDEVELDGERHVVLRLGPSPLPGDARRCAFLEQRAVQPGRALPVEDGAGFDTTGSLPWRGGNDPARAGASHATGRRLAADVPGAP